MRFSVDLELKKPQLPKDKNRIFISLLKNIFENYDKDEYANLYEPNENKQKDYTFSVYLPGAKFEREVINLSSNIIKLNFSSYEYASGIMFYNSILKAKNEEFMLPNDNELTVQNISLVKESLIRESKAVFTTMSPIVIRDHNRTTNKDWFFSFNDPDYMEILKINLSNQANEVFGFIKEDIEELEINILKNRDVKVKNYGIEVLANLATLELIGKPYLLDYFYKAGLGSKTSSGFGMLRLV